MNFIGVCVRDSRGIGNDLSFGLIGFLIKPVRHKEKEGHACGARAPFWRSGFAGFLLLTIFFGSPGPVFAQTESSNCDNATAGDPIHCVLDGASETGDVSIDIENIDVTATRDRRRRVHPEPRRHFGPCEHRGERGRD